MNTYLIYDSPTWEIGANRNRAAKPFLCVNRSPIQYDFWGGTNPIRYRVNIPFVFFKYKHVGCFFEHLRPWHQSVEKQLYQVNLFLFHIIFFRTIINWVTNLSRKITPFNAKWYEAFSVFKQRCNKKIEVVYLLTFDSLAREGGNPI